MTDAYPAAATAPADERPFHSFQAGRMNLNDLTISVDRGPRPPKRHRNSNSPRLWRVTSSLRVCTARDTFACLLVQVLLLTCYYCVVMVYFPGSGADDGHGGRR